MKGWQLLILGIFLGLLSGGGIWLASSIPRGNPVQLLPPPTPAPIQVYITGSVNHPGVYALPVNSRVQDAVQAAGGFSSEADSQAINLAAPLEDGSHIGVPATSSEKSNQLDQRTLLIESELININTAAQQELELLPGIGPSIASNIIAHRETEGMFLRIEEIQKVPGIGPAIYEDIKDLITVDAMP